MIGACGCFSDSMGRTFHQAGCHNAPMRCASCAALEARIQEAEHQLAATQTATRRRIQELEAALRELVAAWDERGAAAYEYSTAPTVQRSRAAYDAAFQRLGASAKAFYEALACARSVLGGEP